jgi:ribulose-5-phosphate 4-epimerase/fuculose-1-phosphate aldolase
LTVGHTVDEAAWFFISMERSCQSKLIAEAAGKPLKIAHESATIAQQQIGNHRVGWFQYQPLWDVISREQPDFFN